MGRASYSIINGDEVGRRLGDWIKAQITAVECGLLSFEGAFLGQIMLPSGETVMEHIEGRNLLAIAPPTH